MALEGSNGPAGSHEDHIFNRFAKKQRSTVGLGLDIWLFGPLLRALGVRFVRISLEGPIKVG